MIPGVPSEALQCICQLLGLAPRAHGQLAASSVNAHRIASVHSYGLSVSSGLCRIMRRHWSKEALVWDEKMPQVDHLIQYAKIIATAQDLPCEGFQGPEQILLDVVQCMPVHLQEHHVFGIRCGRILPESQETLQVLFLLAGCSNFQNISP